MSVGIVQIVPNVAVLPTIYGDKAAGLAELVSVQSECPFPFQIPQSFAVPASSVGEYANEQVVGAFDALTAGMTKPQLLMVRSSGIGNLEQPGQNDSYFIPVDPANKADGFLRFSNALEQLRGSSPQMGAVLTRAVGTTNKLEDGTQVFGATNVSFVADSHSATSPSEMHLALVHGLGVRAVDGGVGYIRIDVDRESSRIVHVGNYDERFIFECGSSESPVFFEHYCQSHLSCFKFGNNKIVDMPIDEDEGAISHKMLSVMYLNSGRVKERRDEPFSTYLGVMPLSSPPAYSNLIGALQFLSARFGPVQIEGSFAHTSSSEFYIYQMTKTEMVETLDEPFKIVQPDFVSKKVIGTGSFKVPLYLLLSDVNKLTDYEQKRLAKVLNDIEMKHPDGQYALMATCHSRVIVKHSRKCRVRLSLNSDNSSGHPAFMMRLNSARQKGGYLFAMSFMTPEGRESAFENLPQRDKLHANYVAFFRQVEIESNGRECRLAFEKAVFPNRRWWNIHFGLS